MPRSKETSEKMRIENSGSLNPNWKGGIRTDEPAYMHSYYMEHRTAIMKRAKERNLLNRDVILERNRIRRKTDINFRLKGTLRARLKSYVKHFKKKPNGSFIRDLGCSINDLKLHLESKFQEGMSWDNHGVHGWHIDHIMPLAVMDLSQRDQFLKAAHYTNLQPLWALDNMRKHTKIPTEIA